MVRNHKDPEKPKRYMSTFLLYLGDFRKRNASKGYSNVEMTRRGASAWRNLTNREKYPYEDKSLKLKEKYLNDVQKYKEKVKLLPKVYDRATTSKPTKDSNKPKKALSAYMLFLKDFRQRNADCGWDFREMVVKGATAWNSLTVAEKGPYEQTARKHAEKYQVLLEVYKKKRMKVLAKQKKEQEKQKELNREWKKWMKENEKAKQNKALAKQKEQTKQKKTSTKVQSSKKGRKASQQLAKNKKSSAMSSTKKTSRSRAQPTALNKKTASSGRKKQK